MSKTVKQQDEKLEKKTNDLLKKKEDSIKKKDELLRKADEERSYEERRCYKEKGYEA